MNGPRRAALRTAAAYAAVALGWILVSDVLVSLLPPGFLVIAQALKGVAFVLVTAVVIYFLVLRMSERVTTEAVRSSAVERMLGQVVTTVPVGVILTSDDGTVTFLNTAASELLGMNPEQALGNGVDRLCCTDEARGAEVLAELMRAGAVDGVDMDGRPGATARSILLRAAQIDPSMPASGWVIAVADMTEAHEARAAAERQLGGYRFLARALDEVVQATDERVLLAEVARVAVESSRYVAAWAVSFHKPSGAYLDVASVGMGERSLEIASMLRERAEADATAAPFSAGDVQATNDLMRAPTSVWHPAALDENLGSVATVGFRVDSEAVGGLTLFSADVGAFDAREVDMLESLSHGVSVAVARLRAERERFDAGQQLEYAERGYRRAFEDSPAPMWVYDRETFGFLAVNRAAAEKYGFSRQEFLSMTTADIRPPGDEAGLLEVAMAEGAEAERAVWMHRDKAGRVFPVHIEAREIEWEGRPAELVMAVEIAGSYAAAEPDAGPE